MTAQAWPGLEGIAYGGDYNPEQWPREVWDEDVALMREAGVNLVSVGIFSWALIETKAGLFEFDWLDDLLDLLHAHGIAVDLGTPTASPPAWFFAENPDARVVTRDGRTMGFGSRGMASHSHPAYRQAITRLADALASRYGSHPAVVMWHVHNEYGVPVGEDFSKASVDAWRRWLQGRYGTLEALNEAWGTAFWGQRYGDWEHIDAPADAPSVVNPSQRLDFARFTDHQLRECFIAERDAIRAHASQPITTNFMAHQSWNTDLWRWAQEVDIVSDDHYLWSPDPDAHVGLALAADLTRSVAGGRPWILMEHSTSAVNWQGHNIAKRPGEMHRNALTHLGRGADGIMFFQWRASRSGAEKFHSAMVPHAGPSSRVFREVVDLGSKLERLAEVQGSRVASDVAVLYDWESLWAQDLEWRPSDDLQFRERMRTYYERLWRDGIAVDFAHPEQDLSAYRLVIAPSSYLLTEAAGANLTGYVEDGGTLLVSCFAGIVDEHDTVHRGGFGAPLAEALGVTVEEFLPLPHGETCRIGVSGASIEADTWSEDLVLAGAEVHARYETGPAAGKPAVTRHGRGQGAGWYISAKVGLDALSALMRDVYADAGVEPGAGGEGLELLTRHGADADYLIAVNHRDSTASIGVTGRELLTGVDAHGSHDLASGECAVFRVAPTGSGGDR